MYKVPDFWVMFLPWGNSRVQEPLTKFTMENSASPRHFASAQWLWGAPCPSLPEREEFLGITRKRKPLSHCPTQGIFSPCAGFPEGSGVGMLVLPGVGCCAERGWASHRHQPVCDRSCPQTSLPALLHATPPLLPSPPPRHYCQ